MALKEIVLHAGMAPASSFQGVERRRDGTSVRWTKSNRIEWALDETSDSGFAIVIPYQTQITDGFIARSRLIVDGEELLLWPTRVADQPCLRAKVKARAIKSVTLATPDPIRSPNNPNDERILGIAMLDGWNRKPLYQPIPIEPIRIADPAAPRIALLGNCLVQTYEWLIRKMLGVEPALVVDYSSAHARKPEYKAEVFEQCRNLDLVLTMPSQYIPVEELRAATPKPVYSFMNLYFRGTLPDSCYIGTINRRLDQPISYHSLVILEAFLRGVPEDECEASFTAANFERLGLADAWDTSETIIVDRGMTVDFPAADLTTSAARRYNAFLTINHPTVFLCYDYLTRIFDALGVPYHNFSLSELEEPLSVHDICIVHDGWAETLKLPYRTSQRYKVCSFNNRFVSRREMIHHFYALYRDTPRDALVVNSPLDLVDALGLNPELRHLVQPGWTPN